MQDNDFVLRIDRCVTCFWGDGDLEPINHLLDRWVVLRCPECTATGRECVLALLERVRHEYEPIDVECEHFAAFEPDAVVLRLTGERRRTEETERVTITATLTRALAADRITAIWVTGETSSPVSNAIPIAHDQQELDAADWAATLGLTRRESSVARLALLGLRDKEIAASLNLTPASASRYMRRVMRKANVHSRWELVQHAGIVCVG